MLRGPCPSAKIISKLCLPCHEYLTEMQRVRWCYEKNAFETGVERLRKKIFVFDIFHIWTQPDVGIDQNTHPDQFWLKSIQCKITF